MSKDDWWSRHLIITPGQRSKALLKSLLAFAAGVSLTCAILYAEISLKQNDLMGIDDASAEYLGP
jgi:hypothetical protein